MGETPDRIRQEVDQKREDAARKIDAIEQRVNETAHRVQEGVTQTTEQVRTTVEESIHGAQQAVGQTARQVTEQVKSTVDWRHQIEERPLVMLGTAFLGGFVLGSVTGNDRGGQGAAAHRAPDTPGYSYGGPLYGSQMSQPQGPQQAPPSTQGTGASGATGGAGMMASLRGIVERSGLQDTLTTSATALLSSIGDQLRTTLEREVPGFAEQMKQRSGQGDQGSRSRAEPGQPSQRGGSGEFGRSARTGQEAEPATTDATGRSAPSPYIPG